jgi:hypothetical protein
MPYDFLLKKCLAQSIDSIGVFRMNNLTRIFWSLTLAITITIIALSSSQTPTSQAKEQVPMFAVPPSYIASEAVCSGDKNASALKVRLRIWEGKLRIDKNLSRNGFEPSNLFKCRARLSGDEKKSQKIEDKLLEDLDKALLQLPRFYLQFVTRNKIEALFTFLPADQRDEFVPFLDKNQKKKLFLYLPEDEQLQVVSDLSLAQKKEFFAYLPDEEKDKVLAASSEAERPVLLAKKKETPPQTAAPANEDKRLAMANYPGDGKTPDAGTWSGFLAAYESWPGPEPMVVALNSFLTRNLTNRTLVDTAILGFDDSEPTQDAVNGGFSLQVTDPIGDLKNKDDYEILVPPEIKGLTDSRYITPSVERIISLLNPLNGELWERQRIAAYINDYFIRDRTGYERDELAGNALVVSPPADGQKCIVVKPIPKIDRILFIGEMNEKDIDSSLRQLLTDSQLRVFRASATRLVTDCKDDKPPGETAGTVIPVNASEVKVQCKQISLKDLVSSDAGIPYLNLQNWTSQQTDLSQAGFVSGLKPFDPNPPQAETSDGAESDAAGESDSDDDECGKIVPLFVQIRITKSGASSDSIIEKPGPTPTPTPASTPSPEASPTPQPSPSPVGIASPSPRPSPTAVSDKDRKSNIEKPKRNRIGAELVYRPDQGIHVNGQYAHFRPGKDDFSVVLGADGGFVVSGDYEGNDLFSGKFSEPYPFQVRSYSDSINNRIFSGVKVDERRSGAVFRVSTELNRNPTLVGLSFEARQETVALGNDTALTKQNVSSLSFGGTYSSTSKGARFRRVWQFEPSVLLGLGIAQPSFAVLAMSGRLHQYFPGQWDLIFDGRLDLATKRTPIFEQPSFGSSDTVRGFRADDAIGRRQWSLKNELNMPVPGTSPDSKGLMKTLREKVKLAAFADVGAIYQTTGSKPGIRFGPGGGVRFTYQGAELQFDWAYGIGEGAFGRGRGRFYFSISREIRRLIKQ